MLTGTHEDQTGIKIEMTDGHDVIGQANLLVDDTWEVYEEDGDGSWFQVKTAQQAVDALLDIYVKTVLQRHQITSSSFRATK